MDQDLSTRPLRILLLTQFYPPVIGGEERHVANLARSLVKRGHAVTVATQAHPGTPDFEQVDGLTVRRLHGSMARAKWVYKEADRAHAPPFPDPELMVGIGRIVRAESPDIVHAHNWIVHSYIPLKKLFGAPLVVTLHDHSISCPKKTLLKDGRLCDGPAFAKCLKCASQYYGPAKGLVTTAGAAVMSALERRSVDLFIPVSRAVATLNKMHASNVPTDVIPNFAPDDVGHHDLIDDPCVTALPATYILFVGDLREYKGVTVLWEAYSKLTRPPPLVLIGRPSPEIADKPPQGVQIFHNWPHSAVMHAWRHSLFGVAPSIGPEPSATVIIEAMASGKPVVVTDVGGNPDLVAHGSTGLVIPPRDSDALAKAMQTLLDNSDLRERMSRDCPGWARTFQAQAVVDRIEAAYRKLLTSRRKRPHSDAADMSSSDSARLRSSALTH